MSNVRAVPDYESTAKLRAANDRLADRVEPSARPSEALRAAKSIIETMKRRTP